MLQIENQKNFFLEGFKADAGAVAEAARSGEAASLYQRRPATSNASSTSSTI